MRIDKRLIAFLFLVPFIFHGLMKASDVTITAGGGGSTIISGGGNGSISMSNIFAPVSYADITFYEKLDSTATGRAPTKGSGTLTVTADFFVAAPLSSSSTASNYCDTENFRNIKATEASNINFSVGRAGFYFSWDAAGDTVGCAFGYKLTGDASPRFRFGHGTSGNTWKFYYSDVSPSVSIAAGTTNYVEVAWDINATHGYCAQTRINGGSWSTAASCSGGTPSNTAMVFGIMGDATGNSSASLHGRVDEIIISSDSERDLYAIRDLGSYPN